jgi:hypothetical protein
MDTVKFQSGLFDGLNSAIAALKQVKFNCLFTVAFMPGEDICIFPCHYINGIIPSEMTIGSMTFKGNYSLPPLQNRRNP